MARVIYGAIVTSIHGKIGGTVFQKNAYGHTIKNTPTMVRPNTALQQVSKGNIAVVSQMWRSLSPANQQTWISFAALFPQYSRHNPSSALSGYAVFMLRNLLAQQSPIYRINTTNQSIQPAAIFAPIFHRVDATHYHLNLNGTPYVTACEVSIFMSPPASASTVINKNTLKNIAIADESTGAIYWPDYGIPWTFPAPVVGQKILVKLQQFDSDDGYVYAPQFFNIIVTT
jgi:hypothetical protein